MPTTHIIAGANVAFAILMASAMAYIGQTTVACAICAMVGAVYGVENTIRLMRK